MSTLVRKLIVIVGAAVLGLCVGAGLGYGPLLRYKSEGVLSMELGTTEYRRYSEVAKDRSVIRQFLTAFPSPRFKREEVENMISEISRGDWHKPVAKITKTDAKDLPDFLILQEQEREKALDKERKATVYLGLRLTFIGPDPQEAAATTSWLGSYIKDVATREAVREQMQKWTTETRQFSDRASERKLKFAFDIEQAQTRAAALKKIVALHPNMARRDSQQVVDVRKDNEKFMSPLAQLVGAESEIIDIKEKLQKLNREIDQQNFAKLMIPDVEAAIGQATSGTDSVARLAAVTEKFFKRAKTAAEQEKLLSLTADLSQIKARFLSQAQFVANPSVPSAPEKPRPLVIAGLCGFVFAFIAAIFLFRQMLIRFVENQRGAGPATGNRRK